MTARAFILSLVALASLQLAGPSTSAADTEDRASWQATSEGALISATVGPRSGKVRIGAMQEWILELHEVDGSPVEQARIAVGGGMPGHGHGLPTQPQVTRYLGDGRFLIEGLRLSMLGQWILAFVIETPEIRDRVVFKLEIDFWSDREKQLLASMRLPENPEPPASPSNRVADSPDAARLGEALFFDTRFSANGKLSCASCHIPERFFTDGEARAKGVSRAGRNTPTIIGAAFQNWYYWDGRRDTLWSQALVPFEAADEMGSSRVAVVRLVGEDPELREHYESVFGPFPMHLLKLDLPKHAGPLGDKSARDAWQRIPTAEATLINRVYANLGKSVAAFERTLPVPRSRFDAYIDAVLDGDKRANKLLTDDELAGLELFLDDERTHCLRCHNGPWLTNGDFHNIGTGSFEGENLDFGRVFGLRSLLMDEFNCIGPYSDASRDQCAELRFLNRSTHVPLDGAFKVPSLRFLAQTAPYMHDGRFYSLEEVMAFYRKAESTDPNSELPTLDLTDDELTKLQQFLLTLSDPEPAQQ